MKPMHYVLLMHSLAYSAAYAKLCLWAALSFGVDRRHVSTPVMAAQSRLVADSEDLTCRDSM